jgi:uncharacterized protein (TIGR03000 family)
MGIFHGPYWKEREMNRPSWKRLAFVVVLAITLFAVADQANAGWWHHGGCCGGVYGPFPSYVAWDAGCCGGGYDWGWYRPWRNGGCCGGWYGGWYAGYGCCRPTYSCCGYDTVTGCCGETAYGSVGVQGTLQPTPAVPTPAKKPVIEAPAAPTATPEPGTAVPGTPTPANPPAPGIDTVPAVPNLGTPSTSVTPDNSGMLTVWVPYDAKVTINGMPTKSTGSRRTFISYDLKPGFTYKYEVKAEVVDKEKGQIVEDTKTVVLTAGASNALAFGFNRAPEEVAAK